MLDEQQKWLAIEIKYNCEGFLLGIITWPDFRQRLLQFTGMMLDQEAQVPAEETHFVITKGWWRRG